MKRALAVLVGEMHDENHYKSLINALPQLDRQGFVLTLELPRDFNPLIQSFMRKASLIYEKANEHKIDMQEAEKRVDQLEAKLIYKILKRYPAAVYLPLPVDKQHYVKREKNQWYIVDKGTGEKEAVGPLVHYTDVIKEVAKHNIQNHGNLQVYAVDVSTKEMKEHAKKGNLFFRISLPETCQQPVEEYLKKARKSAFLGKIPKESLRKKLSEALQKEGINLHEALQKEGDSEDRFFNRFFKQLNNIAKMQQEDKSLVVHIIENGNLCFGGDMKPEFVDYRDQRMSGNLELKEDHKYGPCNIKQVAETRSFYYPGSRVIHWGGAYHLGEIKRQTNLSKEVKKAGFSCVVTADAYTDEFRNYPTDYVFESQKGLQKAITHGIKIQTKSHVRYPHSLSHGEKQKEKDTSQHEP